MSSSFRLISFTEVFMRFAVSSTMSRSMNSMPSCFESARATRLPNEPNCLEIVITYFSMLSLRC